MAGYNSFAFTTGVAIILLVLRATGQSTQTNFFINPPVNGPNRSFVGNDVYALGDVMTVAWTTDWTTSQLAVVQDADPNPGMIAINLAQTSSGIASYQWEIDLSGFGFSEINASNVSATGYYTNVFFFQLYDTNNDNNLMASHYFNITNDTSVSPITQTASQTLSATSLSTAANTATGTAASNSSAAATSTPNSGGLSDAAKIGLGVGLGVGVGCLLLGLGMGYFLLRRLRPRNGAAQSQGYAHPPDTGPPQGVYGLHEKPAERQNQPWVSELPPQNDPHELMSYSQGMHGRGS